MATAEPTIAGPAAGDASAPSTELADQWRLLGRAATFVAILTSPAVYVWFSQYNGWSPLKSLLATLGLVIAFRRLQPSARTTSSSDSATTSGR